MLTDFILLFGGQRTSGLAAALLMTGGLASTTGMVVEQGAELPAKSIAVTVIPFVPSGSILVKKTFVPSVEPPPDNELVWTPTPFKVQTTNDAPSLSDTSALMVVADPHSTVELVGQLTEG